MSFFVYILRTSGNTLYTGQTNNLERRMEEHRNKKGRGAKYVRNFESFELVYQEKFMTRSQALKREAEIKRMKKSQKEKLIKGLI
jgi:predicted GIY-YIG superfamily endonuclease